jgi:hypothetical protein
MVAQFRFAQKELNHGKTQGHKDRGFEQGVSGGNKVQRFPRKRSGFQIAACGRLLKVASYLCVQRIREPLKTANGERRGQPNKDPGTHSG